MNKNITNYQSALDINEIWAAIEPQVDEINAQRKKRKPALLYWLSGAILLLGLVAGSFFLFSGEQTSASEVSNSNLPNEINPSTATVIAAKTNPIENKDTETVAPTAAPIDTKEANTTSSSIAPIKQSKNNSSKQKATTVEKTTDIVLPTASTLSNIVLPTATQNNSVSNTNVSITQVLPVPQPQKAVSNASSFASMESATTSLSKLPITKIGLKVPTSELPELDFDLKNNSLPPAPLYVEKPTFSIEFQTGISAVNRTLSSTGIDNSALDTLLNLRSTFESPLEALHANLLVNAHFPSGFYVSSGVAFTQISEVYSNNSTQSEIVIDSMGVQKRIINITGDTIDVIGPVATTITSTFSKRYYNTYRMIDIPVFIGYQYDFGDWKTDFSLGVFANLFLATEGRIPNTPTTDLDLSTNGDDVYRSRVDYSLQFGIGVSKSLTDKLSIRINPTLRYYTKNFMKENYGLEQQYLLFGGTLGLRMDL